jgi:hypothetical protein
MRRILRKEFLGIGNKRAKIHRCPRISLTNIQINHNPPVMATINMSNRKLKQPYGLRIVVLLIGEQKKMRG